MIKKGNTAFLIVEKGTGDVIKKLTCNDAKMVRAWYHQNLLDLDLDWIQETIDKKYKTVYSFIEKSN